MAQDQAPEGSPWGFELRGQMSFGGDGVASVTYTDGSTSDLTMGSYFTLLLGPIFSPWTSGDHAVEAALLLGWGSWSTGPDNTDDRVALDRFPVDLLAYYRLAFPSEEMYLRAGGGVTYHFISGISGSGSLSGIDVDVDNALGGIVELGFVYTIASLGLRYTIMKNQVEGVRDSLDGSGVAIYLSMLVEPGIL